MTYIEMQVKFEELIQTIDPSLKDAALPNSVTVGNFLTNAQNLYLHEYLKGGMNSVVLNKVEEIAELVQTSYQGSITEITGTSSPYIGSGGIAYYLELSTIDSDFLYYVRSDSYLLRTATSNIDEYDAITSRVWIPNEFIMLNEIDNYITTPINTVVYVKPKVFIEKQTTKKLIVIGDQHTDISALSVTYVKKPQDISIVSGQSCELPLRMHEDIVKMAAESYVLEYKYRLQVKS